MEKGLERRKAKRESFEGQVEVYPVFPSYAESLNKTKKGFIEAFCRDLSWSGVGLKINVTLKVGSFIKLQLALAGQKKFEILGQITWVRDSLCGVNFISFTSN